MELTDDDLKSIRLLLREEIDARSAPFEEEMRDFRNETQKNFDELFKRDETREQEYLAITHQLKELEKKCA